jgi:hypothetical protein
MSFICRGCADWADTDHGELDELGHEDMDVCEDAHIQPSGCPCQHKPKRRRPRRPLLARPPGGPQCLT